MRYDMVRTKHSECESRASVFTVSATRVASGAIHMEFACTMLSQAEANIATRNGALASILAQAD